MSGKYAKASFSIELSYILFIMLMAAALFILRVYQAYYITGGEYIIHYNAAALAAADEVFDPREDKVQKQKYIFTQMAADMTGLAMADTTLSADMWGAEAGIKGLHLDRSIRCSIFKPLFFMRLHSGAEGLLHADKDGV